MCSNTQRKNVIQRVNGSEISVQKGKQKRKEKRGEETDGNSRPEKHNCRARRSIIIHKNSNKNTTDFSTETIQTTTKRGTKSLIFSNHKVPEKNVGKYLLNLSVDKDFLKEPQKYQILNLKINNVDTSKLNIFDYQKILSKM